MNRIKRLNSGPFGTAVAMLAVGILGCSTTTDPGPDPDADPILSEIVGSWSWVMAVGGIAGQGRTPETDGMTRTVVIDAPNRIRLFENGELSVDTTFELVPAEDLGDIPVRAKLIYASAVLGVAEQSIAFSIEGGLLLIDPCCDQWMWEFEKGQP